MANRLHRDLSNQRNRENPAANAARRHDRNTGARWKFSGKRGLRPIIRYHS